MVSLSNQGGPEAHDTLLWFPVPGAAWGDPITGMDIEGNGRA
jgi:hypothetical protein